MRMTSYQRRGVAHDTLTLPASREGAREKMASTTHRQHSQGEKGITWEQAGCHALWGLKRRLTGLVPATTCACMVWQRNILIPLCLVFMSIYQGICWASAPELASGSEQGQLITRQAPGAAVLKHRRLELPGQGPATWTAPGAGGLDSQPWLS